MRRRRAERELLEMAWGIIANAGEGDWGREHADWQRAAAKWRDDYHRTPSSGFIHRLPRRLREAPHA